MKIIFDSGLPTERELAIDHYSENILQNRFNGSANFKRADYPDLSPMRNADFITMHLMDGEDNVPYAGDYNTITGLTVSYDQYTKDYNLSISIGKKTEE